MSKKRRIFDIDFDAAEVEDKVLITTASRNRRGPMATAISETADALADRQAAEAQIREENDRLAHEFVALKRAGQIVVSVPLDQIAVSKLTRDRAPGRDDEIEELKDSLMGIGLSNPIRVEEVDGGYELIQGFRRLTAYRELYEETGDEAWAEIPASVQETGEALDLLYQRMVDENLIRKDLSFGEMAKLAVHYAYDRQTPECTPFEATDMLYASASRQKRSYIRHFTTLFAKCGHAMAHFDKVPRKLGLDLVRRIEEDESVAVHVRQLLDDLDDPTPEAELAILTQWSKPNPLGAQRRKAGPKSSAKTVIQLNLEGQKTKCTASNGKLELQVNRDFSALDRDKLEEAIAIFMRTLDG